MINTETQKILWTNPTPSSTLYCRPIRFMFTKENAEKIKFEYNSILKFIETLECDIVKKEEQAFEISYEMHCTMIDGAVANVLTGTNCASRCFICKASPSEMNNVNFTKTSNVDSFKFGLSTLHCWIRFLECILHIAYRLTFKKWRVCQENKSEFLANKKRIQDEFKTQMGLLIDQVKTGFGTTNDGNTARRFFSHSDISSRITGVDKELIEQFSIILRVLSCGRTINVETFQVLLLSTRARYLFKYNWFYMPSSVHKVLIHGSDVIKFFDIPIGNYK